MTAVSFLVDDDEGISRILHEAHTIAVVGLSGDPSRPSHGVARYLQSVGYRIRPVNPRVREVHGVPAVARLQDLDERVDVVQVFRRPEFVAAVVDDAIAIGAPVLWLQDGVVDAAAARRAHEAGMRVVMDRCMLRDHRRFGGRRS